MNNTLNNGIPRNISANTHPIAHISTERQYFELPHSNSGARYQRLATLKYNLQPINELNEWKLETPVLTCGEYDLSSSPLQILASPKSAILSVSQSSISKFAGFIS